MSQMLADTSSALAIDLVINVLFKGTLVLGAAGLATYVTRGRSAATRHAIWSVALLALLVLPALEAVLPSWRVEPIFVTVSSPSESLQPETEFTASGYADDCECTCDCDENHVAAAPYSGSDGWRGDAAGAVLVGPTGRAESGAGRGAADTSAYLLFLWLLGAGILCGRFAIDGFRVSAMCGRATDASRDDRALARRLAAELGIRRNVRLMASDELSVPVTFGVWSPTIILPSASNTWSADRLRVVLLHELAHVRRWDYAIHVMNEVVCALYWFNPVVWLAARLSSLEQERACDDRALLGGVRSDVYATHLVEIARAAVDPTPRGAFAIAHPSNLATRVKSILARGLDRAPISQRQLLQVAVGAMSVAFPLASMDVWGVLQEERAVAGSVERRVEQLESGDPQVRRYAAWALGELESSTGVDPLIDALADRDGDVRLVAAWALGEIKDNDGLGPLTETLDDEDPLVREMAVLALGEIGSARAIDPIMKAVGNDKSLREPAFWALDQIGGQRAHDARHELFEHRGELGWESDEVWIGYLGTGEARSIAGDVPALIDALGSSDRRMRASAAEQLGDRGDPRAVEALLDALRDPDPRVRAMAIWALDEINPSRRYSSR